MRRYFPIAVLFAAAAGCEPAWSVQGHVQAVDGSRTSMSSALATLRCPGEPDRVARTDRDGVFELGGTGAGPSLACSVVIAAPGRTSADVSLRDACEDPVGDHCSVAMVEVPLAAR
jgi:hypothetical protein